MQGREIEERENLLNIQRHTIVSGLALNVNVKKWIAGVVSCSQSKRNLTGGESQFWRIFAPSNFYMLLQTQREEAKKFAEIKRKLRQEIQELRHTVLQMMGDNQQAPEIEKLDRYEYNLDVDQRQKLILEGEEKIKQVRKAGLNINGNTTPCFTLSSLPFGL